MGLAVADWARDAVLGVWVLWVCRAYDFPLGLQAWDSICGYVSGDAFPDCVVSGRVPSPVEETVHEFSDEPYSSEGRVHSG